MREKKWSILSGNLMENMMTCVFIVPYCNWNYGFMCDL